MTIHDLNVLPAPELKKQLFSCCGSTLWVEKMLRFFPMEELVELLTLAEEQWYKCTEADWREAFAHSPAIADLISHSAYFDEGDKEQSLKHMPKQMKLAFEEAGKKYHGKFGYAFVTAAFKKPEQILASIEKRLLNTPDTEIQIAMDEQNKITLLRLQELLQ